MIEHFDILIVGGGLNGAAMALALKDSAYKIGLLEPKPPQWPLPEDEAAESRWDPRVYAYSPGNVDWLKGLGGWDTSIVRAQAIQSMRIHGDAGGKLHFDALDTGLPELAWIAENFRLQASIWQGIRRAHNLSCLSERPQAVRWQANSPHTHALLLEDGRELHANLLIAADGANSWVREQAGIGITLEDYQHAGVVANFETEKPHRGIAFQWFTQEAVLAYLPLPGNRISIVWSTPTDKVDARIATPMETFSQQVAEAGGHALGQLRQITPQVAFPLKRRRANEWVRPGLVLLGDAAHTVHPLAGQGVNLGFRDSRLLAEMLTSGGNPGEIGRLQSYSARRMEDVASMQFTTGSLKKLFNNPNLALGWLRNTGLVLTENQNWLKQALMRHAIQ